MPWINPDDYFQSYYTSEIDKENSGKINRIQLLDFNRQNYDLVQK